MDLTISLPPAIITSRFTGGSTKRRFLHGEKEKQPKTKKGTETSPRTPNPSQRPRAAAGTDGRRADSV